MISPDRTTLRLSLAGHLPPVLSGPGQVAELPATPVDPPLGVAGHGVVRRTTTIDFAPGAVVVCYTDGLVERRGELIDVGLARLVAAVHPDPAEAVCMKIMASLDVEQPMDDVAVLAIRRRP
jgi:sigma-B regulation protein RsbU (phosphoserine phosphatase)